MPKNFPFYNPEEHQKIISLLEQKNPSAIITATGRNPEAAGAVYPFPMLEDGDFDIPSVYMTEDVGLKLAAVADKEVNLEIKAERQPATGANIIAEKDGTSDKKIVICAHIDSKQGTPGAIDNAAGTVVLLLLAELLAGYDGSYGIEIVSLNGEDYYSAAGEIIYFNDLQQNGSEVLVGINIDGVGFHKGMSAWSLYECPDAVASAIRSVITGGTGITEGEPWYQGDHSIFIQNKIPAVAITSSQFVEIWSHIAHTERDTSAIVLPAVLAENAEAIKTAINELNRIEE